MADGSANPFDQFDAPVTPAKAQTNPFDQFDQAPPAAAAGNPFDQFDAPKPSEDPGILATGLAGLKSGYTGLKQTAQAVTGGRPEEEAPDIVGAQPMGWSDFLHPSVAAKKAIYGLAQSSPTMATAIAGGAAGSALGAAIPVAGETGIPEVIGGIGGTVLGAAAGTMATSMGPHFASELKQTPDDPDGAFARAAKSAATESAIAGIGYGAFSFLPFQGAVKNLLFQTFGVQPTVAAAGQAAQNIEAGRPIGEGVLDQIPGAIIGTAAPGLVHAGMSHVTGAHGAPEAAADEPPPARPTGPLPDMTHGLKVLEGLGAESEPVAPPVESPADQADAAQRAVTEEAAGLPPSPEPIAEAVPESEPVAPIPAPEPEPAQSESAPPAPAAAEAPPPPEISAPERVPVRAEEPVPGTEPETPTTADGADANPQAESAPDKTQEAKTAAQTQAAVTTPPGGVFEPVPKEPPRLVDYLRANGGIQNQGGEISHILGGAKGRPGLINNRSGMTLDDAALKAWEDGYFPNHGEERPSINDFLDAVADDAKGTPQYSGQDAAAADAFQGAMARNAEIDRLGSELDIDPAGMTRAQFFDEVAARKSENQAAADAASQDDAYDEAMAAAESRAKAEAEQRGDAWEPDTEYDQGSPRSLEDLENEYRQEEAARGAAPGQSDDRGQPAVTGNAGAGQKGAGPRGSGARPGRGAGAPSDPALQVANESAPTFYSTLERGIENAKQDKASAFGWRGFIKNLPGVKQEEIDWTGVNDWLDRQKGVVSKADLLQAIRENNVQMQEVMRGEPAPLTKETQAEVLRLSDEIRKAEADNDIAYAAGDTAGMVAAMKRHADLMDRRDALIGKEADEPRYSQYTLPGGENYREMLLTMPPKARDENAPAIRNYASFGAERGMSPEEVSATWRTQDPRYLEWEAEQRRASEAALPPARFRSSHWDEPNILAHVRMDDRTDADGKRTLHVAEIQSDWHQKGRKEGYQTADLAKAAEIEAQAKQRATEAIKRNDNFGFDAAREALRAVQQNEDWASRWEVESPEDKAAIDAYREAWSARHDTERMVPDAPFKTSWHELAVKRLLRYAAENGYDRLSWDTGETNAARYDLSQQVEDVSYLKNPDGTYSIFATPKGREGEINLGVHPAEKLPDVIGKELAEKIVNGEGAGNEYGPAKTLSGVDLKVGGEGMRGFYDKILPAFVNKYAKKWGAKVQDRQLPPEHATNYETADEEPPGPKVHSVDITPAMRDSVMQGQPMFDRRAGDTAYRASGEPRPDLVPLARGLLGEEPHTVLPEDHQKLIDRVDEIARKMVPGANVRAMQHMEVGPETGIKGRVYGAYFNDGLLHTIAYSLESPDAEGTARHEMIHYLKRSGLLTPEEWSTLAAATERYGWMEQHRIGERYPGLSRDGQIEEAVAEHFANWRRDRFSVPDWLGKIFQRIDLFLRRTAAAARSILGKDATPDDILTRIETGEVGSREGDGRGEPGGAAQRSDEPPLIPTTPATADEMAGRQRAQQKIEAEQAMRGKAQPKKPQQAVRETPGFGDQADMFGGGPKKEQGTLFQVDQTEPPSEEEDTGPLGHVGTLRATYQNAAKSLVDIGHDIQMALTPMARGSDDARAIAKKFANSKRLVRSEWQRIDQWLAGKFTPEQRTRMWNAADEQSVAEQTGRPTAGIGLDRLSPDERAAVEQLQATAAATYRMAIKAGMTDGPGLPSYVPRMVAELAGDTKVVRDIRTLALATADLQDAIAGKTMIKQIDAAGKAAGIQTVSYGKPPARVGGGNTGIDKVGQNVSTSTANLLHRKYLTTEETEAAARAKLAGKADPADDPGRWFTIKDNKAFWKRQIAFDPDTGNPLETHGGGPHMESVPIYIHPDFEGPLRAILSRDSGKLYQGAMGLKARTTGLIMYSPLIHNAVEWGRALPAMPGKVLTFRVYFDGNKAKNDPATMREAINAGLAPIGHRGGRQDITSITEDANLTPGRSFTAKVLAAVPGLFDKNAGDSVKRGVDRLGDLWHNTLLWDRVGDLQMGLYTNLRDMEIKKFAKQGITGPEAERGAQLIAAHFANRYAGALPLEAMSSAARKVANLALFSRSFTLGNLGAMKDALTGLPRDVQAQLSKEVGDLGRKTAVSIARRKALGVIAMDIALFHVGNAVLQSAIATMSGDSTLSQEEQGYARRMGKMFERGKENPLDLLNPFETANSLLPQGENEPGKQDRVKVGHAPDGTAIYMRNPLGKIGEEFEGWLTGPLDMVRRKLATIVRPSLEVLSNEDSFGRHIYDPYTNTPSGWVSNIGKIVSLYLGDQVPLQAIQGARDALAGRGDVKMDAAQALGPVAGLTFSKGYPGGEAGGEMNQAKQQHEFYLQQAMPGIRRQIQDGDIAGARARMASLGIPPGLQGFYIRTTQNPGQHFSKRQMQDFLGYATPEQRGDLQRYMNPGSQEASP